jgi:hypothetical protein
MHETLNDGAFTNITFLHITFAYHIFHCIYISYIYPRRKRLYITHMEDVYIYHFQTIQDNVILNYHSPCE